MLVHHAAIVVNRSLLTTHQVMILPASKEWLSDHCPFRQAEANITGHVMVLPGWSDYVVKATNRWLTRNSGSIY